MLIGRLDGNLFCCYKALVNGDSKGFFVSSG
jgi:hypothetical protein